MRKFFLSLILLFSIFIYHTKLYAFDFAPEVGDLAPDFSLSGVNTKFKNKTKWDLKDFKDKWLSLIHI